MAFTDFKSIQQVQQNFSIKYTEENYIEYVVIEAKQNNFTESGGQCLAELLAAPGLPH